MVMITQRIQALLDGIDFGPAQGRLVVSFPMSSGTSSTRDLLGGYRQLAMAVKSFQNEVDFHGSNASSPSSDNDDDANQNHANNDDDDIPEGGILYATSGSMGDLQPDFILQMYEACSGRSVHASKSTPWHNLYNKARVLWPSRETALTMNLMALIGNGRSMSRAHWNKVIPTEAKRRMFMDARPNPTTRGELPYFPFLHGKFIYLATPNMTVVYVGSHNFSKSAWGLRGQGPKNVELGVVLATTFSNKRNEWKCRLPCLLPAASATYSPPSYIPASAHSGIRQVLQQGNVQEAMEMMVEWLSRNEDNDNGTQKDALSKERRDANGANENDDKDSNVIKAEVVDLCDDSD